MAKQQISLPVTQMHAVSFAITEKLTVGTLPFAHPLAVTIRLIFVIPHLHKVILINIALMIVGTNTTYLSNVVNHYFKCNFKHLLNKCRVKYAKLLLDKGKYTPEELVKLCGFTSRSVFYSAFTKEVGMVPSRYPDKSFKIPLKYD